MDRRNWYKGQTVGEADLDGQQDSIEKAIADALDATTIGAYPVSGLAATANGSTMVLSVTAGIGIALDGTGRSRLVRLAAPLTKDLTSAIPVSNPRWATLALHFTRYEHQSVVDDDNVTLNYLQDESAELVVLLGAEAGSPVKPSIPADHIPLADVRMTVGMTLIATKHLEFTRCRPVWARQGTTGGVAAQLADIAALLVDNCRPYIIEPQSSNALKVGIRAGTIVLPSGVISVSAQQLTLTAPSTPGNHRIALVYLDSAGGAQVEYGAESAGAAVTPSLVGRFPVATVDIYQGDTAIDPARIVDIRPVMQMVAPQGMQRYTFTAAGGETDITLPFSYVPGSAALMVFKQGAILKLTTDYTESSATVVHLAVAATAGHVYQFIAPPAVSFPSPDLSAMNGRVDDLEIRALDATINVVRCAVTAGGARYVLAAPTTIDISGIGSGNWCYLYGYVSAGAIAFEASTTTPDATKRFKGGDTTRIYLGCARKTSTGKVRAFFKKDRRVRYLVDFSLTATSGVSNNLLMASQTGDTGAHDISCVEAVPPHVFDADIAVDLTGAAAQTATLTGGGGTGSAKIVVKQNTANGDQQLYRAHMNLDVNQAFSATASSGSLVARYFVEGFDD